jgi:hypothetical protein
MQTVITHDNHKIMQCAPQLWLLQYKDRADTDEVELVDCVHRLITLMA